MHRATPSRAWYVGLALLWVLSLGARLLTLPEGPDTADSVLFIRGVERFSIQEMRPHWPGYPVYIGAGKLLSLVTGSPVLALRLVSVLSSTLTLFPLAAVARRWALSAGADDAAARRCGLVAGALWVLTPVSWITGSFIVSDPFGLLLATVVLLWTIRGMDDVRWDMAAATLGGVLLGVRAGAVTLLIPLIARGLSRRHDRWRGRRVGPLLVVAFTAGLFPWLGWVLVRTGIAYFTNGYNHMAGHFLGWGGTFFVDRRPWDRPVRFLSMAVVQGLGGWLPGLSVGRVIATVAWVTLLALSWRMRHGRVASLVALWVIPYVILAVFLTDLAFVRYVAPAAAATCIVAALGLARLKARAAVLLAVPSCAALALVTVPLARKQHRQPPAELQAAMFLTTIRPTPILALEAADFGIGHFAQGAGVPVGNALGDLSGGHHDGRAIVLTTPPREDPRGWVPAGRFCRDPLLDPVLRSELWLFAYAPGLDRGSPLQCGETRPEVVEAATRSR